jgi:transcriptional regulator with GAF, ATPase, and Fis domain
MGQQLIGLTGTMEGTVLAIGGPAVSIGRDAANSISLPDPAVSPEHCMITRSDGHLTVDSLDPTNPVYVNGLPASHQLLHEGDHLRIGDSIFVVDLREAGEDSPTAARQIVERRRGANILLKLRREDVLFGVPAASNQGAPGSREATDLRALAKIATAITAIRDIVQLQGPLLDLIFEAVPADRGTIVLLDDNGGELSPVAQWDRLGAAKRNVTVNKRILDVALREGVAVLAREEKDGDDAEAPGAVSVAVAPLVAFDRVLGAMYLEANGRDGGFDEAHLQLLSVIGGMTAVALDHGRQVERLDRQNRRLQAVIGLQHDMVGASGVMRNLHDRMDRIARADATVLLRGESGTGKELAARAIHQNGARASRPFVAINCAAITETLLESELFGHERGAFTGAAGLKHGKLELADGGTVLLDEIGELPLSLQAKLLRVLQEREFERVGGTRRLRVDFRLVAATNRDLEQAIKSGGFREDLYYRIAVVTLTIPPLRDRPEDILALASHFVRLHTKRARRTVSGFSPEALECLTQYPWPGNVRELDNAIEHAIVLGSTETILREDLPSALLERASAAAPRPTGYHDAVREAKTRLIQSALERSGGNCAAAARMLDLDRNYLHRLIRNLRLHELHSGLS